MSFAISAAVSGLLSKTLIKTAPLLFLLKFWMDDSSPSFEKTDMAIEKSVQTVFELFDNTPLDSVIDFGKFLWNEKFKIF